MEVFELKWDSTYAEIFILKEYSENLLGYFVFKISNDDDVPDVSIPVIQVARIIKRINV